MSQLSGLTESEVQKLLKIHGYNEIPSSEHRTIVNILKDIMKEPMFLLLVACGVIYLLLGNRLEAQMLLAFVFVIMGITFYQQRKTETALLSLKNLSSPRAIVVRNGKEQRVSGREIVPGDIVVLAEGDRVPADGVIISCSNLYIDESLVTGESE
ncbi:MAG TPA: cation-transporting P-type ATPase, partial [bacterium]|nr:cation-transporting P-type ATPase [bacterium]